MRTLAFALFLFLLAPRAHAIFGMEMGPLLELVAGQVQELERLSEQLGVAKDQANLLVKINEGIEKTVSQIRAIESLLERSQGLDPGEVKSLSDLNDLISRMKATQGDLDEVMGARIDVTEQAIAKSAMQIDTTYKMGQEMVVTGSQLAQESQTASPGRAQQIAAAASSAQMLSDGVQLQAIAHMVQLQALLLEFQKSQIQQQRLLDKARRVGFQQELKTSSKKRKARI